MHVFVPYDARNPKSRLTGVLDDAERHLFARAMLDDVLDTLQRAGHDPTVLATAHVDCEPPVRVDERPLTTAVNDAVDEQPLPVGIVMADLALVTVDALDRLFGTSGDVAVAPGLGGGTNALVIRHPKFRVDYHGASVRDHWDIAERAGADVSTVDSFRLALDVDDRDDLVEVLLHSEGAAARWLADAGFTVARREGRTTIARPDLSA